VLDSLTQLSHKYERRVVVVINHDVIVIGSQEGSDTLPRPWSSRVLLVLGRSACNRAPGTRLRLNLVNKYRASGVICDLACSSRWI
jgi:hypothetical protein